MSNNDDGIYRQLQIQLDRYPIGYPATKSGVEIDLLKYFFTPLEAKIALCLTLRSISLTPIRKRLKGKFFIDLSPKELSALLDEMFQKGVIRRSENGGSFRYGIAMLAIGMFEYHVDDLTPELVKMMHQYFDEAFGAEFFRSSPAPTARKPASENFDSGIPCRTLRQHAPLHPTYPRNDFCGQLRLQTGRGAAGKALHADRHL